MSVALRGLQVGEGRGPVVACEFDQGAVIEDHTSDLGCRGCGQRAAEVGDRFGVTTRVIVEDAAVQRGNGEPVIALERAGVIVQGLAGSTQCLVSDGAVEVALGRVLG